MAISSIVVGIDGSGASDRALRMACAMTKQFGASLHMIHTPREETVTFAAETISGFYIGVGAGQQELLEEAAQKVIEKAHVIAKEEGVDAVDARIAHGDPAGNVLACAEEMQADLIVTGRRGLGDLGSLVLGSTSHQISKNAKCACMTVP
jgi:nucleotide-binding universal stress UspA family protein